jgi:hypothetical protein
VYSDEERFGLSDDKCAIGLWPMTSKGANSQGEQFDNLIRKAKRGGFSTDREVFAVVEGRFVTEQSAIGTGSWSPGYAAGASPTVLVIERVECSVIAPIKTNSEKQAAAHCE